MRCEVRFPAQWIDASAVEMAVRQGGHPHGPETYDVEFRFPIGSKLMIDAAIRILSLANQLATTSRRVRDHGEFDFAWCRDVHTLARSRHRNIAGSDRNARPGMQPGTERSKEAVMATWRDQGNAGRKAIGTEASGHC